MVGSSLMYALRITQVAGGREHIIQHYGEFLKRVTNRPYQQIASKDATNYLAAFVRQRSGTPIHTDLRHLEGCNWARNTEARRTDWPSIWAPSTSTGPCCGGT